MCSGEGNTATAWGDGALRSGPVSQVTTHAFMAPVLLLVLRCRWTPWTTPTPATATTVLRLRLPRGDAAEQRLDRGMHFLLNQVPDDCHQALLSRHRLLPSGAGYTAPDTRKCDHQQSRRL